MADHDSREEQAALDETLRAAIRPATTMIAVAYAISGVAHAVLGGADRAVVAPVEILSALGLIATRFWLLDRNPPPHVLHRVATGVAWVVLLNNFTFLALHGDAQHPFVLYLLTLGVSMLSALPIVHYGGVLAGTAFVVGFAAYRSPEPWAAWVEPGLVLLAMFSMGYTLRVWSRAQFTRVSRLASEAEESRRAREVLHTRYRELTDMATEMIAELDDEGHVLYANPAHQEIFGYAPEELVGAEIMPMLGVEVPADRAEGFERMLREPLGPMQIEATNAFGQKRVVEMSSRPFTSHSGERRVVVTSRDVTQRAGLEAERARYRQELEGLVAERTRALEASMVELQRRERLAAVGTLAAGVAHQINNPVGAILLSADFALRESRDGEPARNLERTREALRSIVQEAHRCGGIVRNLLRFARDGGGEPERVEVAALVDRVIDLCQPYAADRGASIARELQTGEVFVEGRPVEIEEALINLIRNAIEAGPSPLRVSVRLLADVEHVVIEVEDDGRGISEEEIQRVFDPFFTTKLSGDGTGLGLSIAHAIADEHGGTLAAESKPGDGTTMRLSFPRRGEGPQG